MQTIELKKTTGEARRRYAKQVEKTVRSFGSYLSEIRKDLNALNVEGLKAEAEAAAKAAAEAAATAKQAEAEAKQAAAKAKKAAEAEKAAAEAEAAHKAEAAATAKAISEEKKQQAEAAAAKAAAAKQRSDSEAAADRLADFRIILSGCKLKAEDIAPAYLRTWLSFHYDSEGRLCDLRKVTAEEEKILREENKQLYIDGETVKAMKPIEYFTTSKILALFAKASRCKQAEEKKQAEEATAAGKAAAAAERKAKAEAAEANLIARIEREFGKEAAEAAKAAAEAKKAEAAAKEAAEAEAAKKAADNL